ncbi:MAG TPA: MBOAT family O-acyltransferase [Anaerolineales bacterium]|nr:MBOAT family O-acyltransferase [Anaerolineales bacterium]
MSLASHLFILIFLPLALLLYYWLFKSPRSKMFFLLAASLLFYTTVGWGFTLLLLGTSAFTYWAGRKNWYLLGILFNLGILALFKYWNFGVETFNQLLNTARLNFVEPLLQLGLPLGISFYTFRHVSYLLDLKVARYPPADQIWSFLTFSFYFPQISAGPISDYKDVARQFSSLPERLEYDRATTGFIYLSYGLVKKVLIADQIRLFLTSNINTAGNFPGLIPAWYILIAYAIQLYFDFSGYTDMALGASILFGIKLPENFNSPYLAQDVNEFWKRWHISLSTWFRYYLFSPISRSLLKKWGSSQREWAQYSANLLTMSLIGVWHGAGWGYFLWGLYHGILLNLNTWQKHNNLRFPSWFSRSAFLLSILFGWTLFMSPDWAYFRHLIAGLIGIHGLGNPGLLNTLWQHTTTIVLLAAIPLTFSGYAEAASLVSEQYTQTRWKMLAWGVLAALSMLAIQQGLDFLYIQF